MKIPEQANRVFKGIIFDTYQWSQKMFDGSEKTFEMLKRLGTVLVLPTVGDKVITTLEEQPNHPMRPSLLGGRQEKDEEPIVTAKRELMEEAGLASDDWELLMVVEAFPKIDWNVYIYVARNCQQVGSQQLDGGERIKLIPASFEEFLTIVSADNFWGPELAMEVMRLRLNPDTAKLEGLRRKLFPNV